MTTVDLENYNKIFEQNKQWVQERTKEDPDFFTNLSKEQRPDFLFIGCSDSRVPANVITGLDAGKLFVHRNIANVVSNTDMNVLSVVQYAVEQLNVKHIVVCGHYGCGGVQTAMLSQEFGLLDNWLRNIRDVYRLHRKTLDAIEDAKERSKKLVELNIQEQCFNVIKTAHVQKSYLRKGYPTVHGWVYDIETGILNDLNINFDEVLEGIRAIYRLT